MIQEIYGRLIQGEQDEPLINQRTLKKQERIVKVWDVEIAYGLITQIFETDDGNAYTGASRTVKPEHAAHLNRSMSHS